MNEFRSRKIEDILGKRYMRIVECRSFSRYGDVGGSVKAIVTDVLSFSTKRDASIENSRMERTGKITEKLNERFPTFHI